MAKSKLKWACCDGGPHLLLPGELLPAWEGINPPSNGRVVNATFRFTGEPDSPATDYDLACDVQGVVGLIPVGKGQGLVIGGDEVPMSTWIEASDKSGGFVVIPLEWGDLTDDIVTNTPAKVPGEEFEDTGLEVRVEGRGLVLFAACDSSDAWVYACVEIPILPGIYKVLTIDFEPDASHLFRIHRLQKVSDLKSTG